MKARGYTLLELLVTLVISSILFIGATSMFRNYSSCKLGYKGSSALADVGAIFLRADAYSLNNGRNPISLDEIGLGDLVDPWGNSYVYLDFAGIDGNGQKRKHKNSIPVNSYFDLYSMGADGKTATPFTAAPGEDDIVIAGNGSYLGLACDYGT